MSFARSFVNSKLDPPRELCYGRGKLGIFWLYNLIMPLRAKGDPPSLWEELLPDTCRTTLFLDGVRSTEVKSSLSLEWLFIMLISVL